MDMVLAKTDLRIASRYADLVADQMLASSVFARIEARDRSHPRHRAGFDGAEEPARNTIRRWPIDPVTGCPISIALNLLQLDLLRRRRSGKEEPKRVAAIHMSINGVSAGLRNSG